MQVVVDFVEGKMPFCDFLDAWRSQPEISDWLEGVLDLKSPLPEAWTELPLSYIRLAIHKHHGGSFRSFTASEGYLIDGKPRHSRALEQMAIFHAIASIVVVAYPNTKLTKYYDEEYQFCDAVLGNAIGGAEVECTIEDMLKAFPNSMSKATRKKTAKQAMNEVFHIESKRPRWIQEPEWPMGEKSPMKFLSQKQDGDKVEFVFVDVDTNTERTVTQYF